VHYWRKSKEIEGNIFLTLETLNPTFWYFLSVSGYEYYYSIEKELQHQWLVLFFVVVLGMLFSITAFIQKKTIENVKNNTNSFNLL
jgi:hypothetical protein